jgi:hypothetical protein
LPALSVVTVIGLLPADFERVSPLFDEVHVAV